MSESLYGIAGLMGGASKEQSTEQLKFGYYIVELDKHYAKILGSIAGPFETPTKAAMHAVKEGIALSDDYFGVGLTQSEPSGDKILGHFQESNGQPKFIQN